jgi:fumarate reductase subunit C
MDSSAKPASYTSYHPRWFRRRVSTYWWMGRWPYMKFILREISSVFVAWSVLVMLLLIRSLGRGAESYALFENWLRSPAVVFVNLISLLFVVFHTITWFNLAPRATVVRVGGKRVPDLLISGPQFAAWIVVSVFVAWVVLQR